LWPSRCHLRSLVGHHIHVDGDTGNMVASLRPQILRYCLARLPGQRDTADDVTQETCIALLKALDGYDGTPQSLAYGIAAHKVADAIRAAARRAIPVDRLPDRPDPAAGPEETVLSAQRTRDLLETLQPSLRALIALRVLADWSAEQTAEALGMSAGAVRVAQHRAMGRLRSVATAAQ
jgi:RNA polymerase sigma-70 factor (ECF subfamily)